MDQVHVIRHKVLVEGQSQRQVADDMGISRNTIRKYLVESEPVRKSVAQRGRPVLEAIRERLDELLTEWSARTTKKQRLTARRLYKQLREEGFTVGETTVRSYVRQWKRRQMEIYVPLVHRPGEEAQVDYFEVTVELSGERVKRWMFLMRLMYSGRDFARLYERCDMVSFLDAHVRAFEHFGGVPGRLIYDNLRLAVRRVLFPGRQLTTRFMALCSHYLFEPCFTRVGTGHDKGGVEGRGKGIRLQHLVPVPRGESLELMADKLLLALDEEAKSKQDAAGRTVMERFSEELSRMRPLPEYAFEPRLAVPLTIDRKSLVRYDGATYSLPTHWKAAAEIMAYVGPVDIRFIYNDEIIVRTRVRRHEQQICYVDYLGELKNKPQAVRQVAPELLASMGEPFKELWQLLEASHGGKEAGRIFARVLGAVVDHGEAAVGDALKKALDTGKQHLLELAALRREPLCDSIEVPESLRQYAVEMAYAADFDHLLEAAP